MSNPSIERTSLCWLRQPKDAAHVERQSASRPLLERAIANRRNTTWLDVQHQYLVIAQRVPQRPALHALAAMAAVAVTAATGRTHRRPTRRRAAVVVDPAAVQGHAGRELVRQFRTRWPKCSH